MLGGTYFVYLLFTQPQAALRIFSFIAVVLGKIFYGLAMVLYNIFKGIFNFISNITRRRR
jgi:hypothetical protein